MTFEMSNDVRRALWYITVQYQNILFQKELTMTQKILLELCYNVGNHFRITVCHLGILDTDFIPWPHLLINLIMRVPFALGLLPASPAY